VCVCALYVKRGGGEFNNIKRNGAVYLSDVAHNLISRLPRVYTV
jgi:hypothetical protein